jgi:cell division protein FtsN
MPEETDHARANDCAQIRANAGAMDHAFTVCPGLRTAYAQMCEFTLAARQNQSLPPSEAAMEQAAMEQAAAENNIETDGIQAIELTEEELMAKQYSDAILQKIIQFDFDNSMIKPEFTSILDAHAKYLVKNPEQKVTASVGRSETLIPVTENVKEKISDSAKNANQKNSVKADKRKKTGLSTAALVRHEGAAAGVAVVSKTVPADSPGDAGVSLKSSYVVHVGSFKSEKRASRQLARLQKKGFSAYIAVVDLKGKGVWQRVMVSGGATREDAKAVQAKRPC